MSYNNQNFNILHRRSVIKHGNFKFDVDKDINMY